MDSNCKFYFLNSKDKWIEIPEEKLIELKQNKQVNIIYEARFYISFT